MINRSIIPRTRLAAVLLLVVGIIGGDIRCSAIQYQPIDAYSPGDECALVLDGPGRSSLFDYTYNLLRGSFPPSAGSQTCITYDAVNQAYIEARKRINVAQPNTETWRGEDLATVGELLLDISINLAQKYGLTQDDIEKGLPLIDTSKTLIREICPAFLSNVECHPGKYRRYDGLCTNLENPTWGATMTPFSRLLSPKYSDGINSPRISVTGNQLPLSRVVSRTMHPDEGYHDHAGTVMVIAWGQFMDHDYTLTATPLDSLNRNDPEECCHRPAHLKNPYCNEIIIPEDDYFYRLFNVRCMDFVRGFPAPRPGCRLGSRVQFNLLTGVLDGNTVYGVSENFARKLRTGYGGLLRMNPVFSEYGLKDLLPLKLDIPDEGCTRPNRSMYCFEAGEIRVNEQLVLTCMHTLLAREHNRAANALAQVNPHWDDETIFQEARRIVIAEIQHVTYNEFLPILLGKEVMEKFGLLLEKDGYWDGYDPTVNPGVIDAFAAAAYRFGHSLLPTAVERWSKAHKFIASKRLSDLIRRPYDLYRAGVLDEYFMGLMNQVAQAMDDSITQEVTNHLFKKVGAKFGMDLVSLNMQRGREFGLPSYMEFRKFCGLPGADNFEELFGSMPNETIRRYSSIFEHPSDVDLWSGGVSERPLPGSMLGPTFACIIATQFSFSRRGDRFWYELPNQPSSFTPEQLTEIRKSRLARLICDNTDLIDTIQLYPMVLPDHEINPRVPCRSGVLPSMDFSKWAEFPSSPTLQAAQYNYPGLFPPRSVSPPPLAYARFGPRSKLVKNKRKLLKSPRVKASRRSKAGLRPQRRSAFMIQRSTRIYGAPRSGYFFEKSETEIGPINNIIEEKGFSVKDLFDAMSKGVFPLRDAEPELESMDDVETEVPEPSENAWRLLAILKGDLRSASETYGAVSKKNAYNFHGRHKRDVGDEEGVQEEQGEALGGKTGTERKGRYTPILKECNDAAASEVSDLNAAAPPVSKRRSSLREYNPRNGEPLPDIDFSRRKNQLNLKENEESIIEATTLPTTVDELGPESPKESAKNETYINLKDHQLDAKAGPTPKDSNGYPIDIPVYNPDVIPYVDVPDYSDEREESLDKDDRRVAKEKYVEEDADVVDPEVPTNGEEKRLEEIIVREDETAEKANDEAKDGEDEELAREEEEDVEEILEPLNEEEEEQEVKEQEETTISKGGVKEPESVDQPFDFVPIKFDINEYKKPFDLEELFKDIQRQTQTSQDQKNKTNGDVNEHQGSRNVPVRDDGLRDSERQSEDGPSENGEDPVKKGNAKSEEINAAIVTRNFFDEFDKIFDPATSEKPFLGYFEDEEGEERDPASSSVQEESENPSEHPYGNEETFERLFGSQDKRSEPSSAGKTDDDANYEQRSEEDEADFFAKLKTAGSVEPENDSLRDAYITLATIMAKKDDVSRLDEEVAEKAKKEGKMPDMYNNYWTLEYGTPLKQDQR